MASKSTGRTPASRGDPGRDVRLITRKADSWPDARPGTAILAGSLV
ncbi:hypothetical protein [Rubrivirga sp.]